MSDKRIADRKSQGTFMNISDLTDERLVAFLEERLSNVELAAIEQSIREQPSVAKRVEELVAKRDSGEHSIGAIWKRHRLSCPSREELQGFLTGKLAADHTKAIEVHIQHVGCDFCRSNLSDLKASLSDKPETQSKRTKRFFDSSVRRLPKPKK